MSDFPTERDPVYGWESVHEPDYKPHRSPHKQFYADMSKNCYDLASEFADTEQQELVDKYNALGTRYYRLSVGLPAENNSEQ